MEASESSINRTLYYLAHTKRNRTYSYYYQHSLPVAAVYIVAYLFIFVLCMVGNSLVCFIVLRNRRMRTVTNFFILNLAISDLLVGIFCVPTTLVDNLITGKGEGEEMLRSGQVDVDVLGALLGLSSSDGKLLHHETSQYHGPLGRQW